jgi:RimK-like ATP-grasp domain
VSGDDGRTDPTMPNRHMPVIATYFTPPGFADPPFDSAGYAAAYRMLGERVRDCGAEFVVVRGLDSHCGKGIFARGWRLDADGFKEVTEAFAVDVLFDKGDEWPPEGGFITVPSKECWELCNLKHRTYSLFPHLFPITKLVREPGGLLGALPKLRSTIIAAKPPAGAAGRGVVIAPRGELPAQVTEYPLLVQAFIDTSRGIPGLVESTHDLRVVVVGGIVAFGCIRTPAEGSLVANLDRGGSMRVLDVDGLPEGVLEIVEEVDRSFARFPERVYSIDMGLHKEREWKIFELNAPPGLPWPDWGNEVSRFYDILAAHFVAMSALKRGVAG